VECFNILENVMRRLALAIAFIAAVAGSASAEDRAVQRYYFACKSTTDLAALLGAVGKQNDDSFEKIGARVFPERTCTLIAPGDVVHLVQADQSERICVRIDSMRTDDCFWTGAVAFVPKS
jgi:hypothetical protein